MLGNKLATTKLQEERESVIDQLTQLFVDDQLGVDDYENALDDAHRAEDSSQLKSLRKKYELEALKDIPTVKAELVKPNSPRRDTALSLAIMGGSVRKGQWQPAEKNRAVAIMGGVDLDFREAIMPPGVTELDCVAFMGGISITVPPDLAVDCHGIAIMGGFEGVDRALHASSKQPVLRISGVAIMGGVEIKTKPRKKHKKNKSQQLLAKLGHKLIEASEKS